ncbi:202_t:CDS:2 [Ambispora gerdemannii]|uniref:202_t:CDS:1 n=1 Tax=Ambispora gerdemannii TaxID=144530 RepID=A0A9N8Z6V6_9GLOM|nr:202_t:CDS:2 [Ambispora gerdemannii]
MAKLSKIGKITLGSILLFTIVVTVLECLVIYFHVSLVSDFTLDEHGKGISTADLIYHSIFLFSLLFQILLVADALHYRNTIQIVALVIFNLLSLAYAGIQLYQHKILEDEGLDKAEWNPKNRGKFTSPEDTKKYFEKRIRPLEYTIIGLVTMYFNIFTFLSYKLMTEFGWENYKTYSADVKIRNAYVELTILQTLIKMDVFFVLSYAVQLIPSHQIGYPNWMFETVLICVLGPVMLLLAWWAATKEQKYAVLVVINILFLSEGYLLYRLVRVNIKRDPDPYRFTRRFLSFFLATTFVLVAITIVYAIICFRNMMRGTYVLTVFGIDDVSVPPGDAYTLFEDQQPNSPTSPRKSNRMSQIEQNRLSKLNSPRILLD